MGARGSREQGRGAGVDCPRVGKAQHREQARRRTMAWTCSRHSIHFATPKSTHAPHTFYPRLQRRTWGASLCLATLPLLLLGLLAVVQVRGW